MEAAATFVALTDDQLEERFASGELRCVNRIGWAQSYLGRVGAIERPSRGVYLITDLGRRLLETYERRRLRRAGAAFGPHPP